MKKIGIILAIIAIVAFAGCGTGGSSSSGGGGEPFVVDLNTLTAVTVINNPDRVGEPTGLHVRNADAFTKNYDDLMILLPQFPVDITQFQRVTIKCKYFSASGVEIAQGDTRAMVSFIYDLSGDWRGPAMGAGPNTPLKEMNVGGFSGLVSVDRGVRVRFSKQPSAILFQNSDISVAFIELTELVFHNGNWESPAQ